LLEGIEIGRTVTELDLSRNFIGDTGAEMFLRHLKDDSCLREVNLENCGITSAGCSILSDVILTNKSLRNLDLSVNFIGDQGILKLSNALDRNKHIKTLGLNMCGISNDGFSKLLDILEGNATLTMLKLCYNRLGREHSNPEATSDNLKYRVRIVTSSNPKLKLLLWGNTFEESNTNAMSQFKELNATL
jgi:Ran GTPase-activating protein (RanGAP) involved in mRNA processing and transport